MSNNTLVEDVELTTQVESFATDISKNDLVMVRDESGVLNHHVLLLTGNEAINPTKHSPATLYKRSFLPLITSLNSTITIKTKKQLTDTPHKGRGKNGMYIFKTDVKKGAEPFTVNFAKTYIDALKKLAGRNELKIIVESSISNAFFEIENTDYNGLICPIRTF